MIERHWKGLARAECAQDHVLHLRQPQGVEFLVVTRWASMESIVRFAGDAEPTRAVVPAIAAEMMVEYDSHAHHYEAVE